MRFSRLISLVMVLVLAASLLAPVSAYAAAPGAAFAEAEAPEDSSLPGGDDGQEADPPASEPQNPDPADPGEDSGDVSPAPEAPAEDDSLPAEEGTEPAEDIHEEEEVAPADAPDAPQGELHQMVQAVAGTTATLSLEHSYVLADTLVIPANTTLTLTSKAKLHSALRRRDDAQHQHTGALIRLSPGATLILKNISLMGTSPGHAGHGPLLQVEDKATLRLEAGASLLNNGGSPAISVLAGGAAEMKAGELLDCGIGGYAVANQGSFSFSGGLIWFDGSPAGGGILNQGTLNLSGKAAINAGTTGVLNAGQFTMAGGTLTGPDAFEGWAAGGTGVQNQAGGEFTLTGGTIQRFACGAANSGSMEMGGGAIKDNTATQTDIGAGIHNSGGLHIKGGAITGNKGGAGYAVYTIANLRLSGKPVIGAKAVYGGVYLARAGSAYPLILVESKLAKGSLVVIEDSEQLDRHAVRRLENGSPTTLLAEELGYFACCDGLSTLKQASDDAGIVYKLEKSSLQQTINGKSGGSATAPVVVALGYGTQVGETLVIQNLSGSGTKARHIKLVGGSLVRSPGFGGVMLQVPAGSSLWLEDVEIDGALYGGAAATGALVQNSGTLTLAAGARLHGNALSGAEATAGVVNNATMKMTGGEISGNTGRAIENKKLADGPKPALTISGGEISNNSVIGAGAGVASYKDAAFTMSGGAITGNTAARQPNDYPDLYALGGGVYCRGGFTFKGGLIHKNKATDYGGGIYADSCTLNLNGGRVLENRTFDHDDPSAIGGSGGGIYSYGATVKMTAGAVSGNTGYAGGGLCLMGYSAIMDNDHSVPMGSMTMSGGEVAGNTAEVWGGGISNDNAALILSGGSISGNSAGNLGGGVYNLKDSVYHPGLGSKFSGRRFEMKGGEVSGNTAAYGGGVYSAGTFKHTKGSLTDNTANCGGAVYNLYGNVFSFGSGLMQNNRAVASPAYGSWDDPNVHTRPDNEPLGTGGGVLNFGWIDMTAGTISGNMAEGNGGGIYNRGSLAMTAGSILENSAQKGIDIYAGIGVSVNEQALVRLSGKPKIGTKTAAGGIYFDRSATNNSSGDDHVPHGHIKMPSTLSSGAFIRIAGTAVLEGTGSSDHIIVEKAKGNLTSAEQKMFFCGAMGYQMMLQGEYFKQNNIPGGSNRILVLLPAKNKLQTMVHSATGGTAAKPVVLTLPENTQLSSTLAIQGSKGEARHVTLSGAGLSRGQNFKATMINIPAGSSLTLQNIQLSATATDLATVAVPAVTNSGTLTLKAGATLTGASSSANGAAIRNNAGGTLTIAGGAISGNSSAGLGGAVYNLGRLNMTDGIFTGNTAQGGGAIAGGGVIQLGGGAIEDNQAQNGGGLYLEAGGEAALGAARLAGNQANAGGAAYSAGALELRGAVLTENSAQTGGGIHSVGSLTLTGGDVVNNSAAVSGGGVYTAGGSLAGSGTAILRDNTSAGIGGGIHSLGTTLALASVTVRSNHAPAGGAGIYLESGDDYDGATWLLGGLLDGNMAVSGSGGGLYASGAASAQPLKLELAGLDAKDNSAQLQGGAVALEKTEASFESGTLSANLGVAGGGGFYVDAASTLLVYGGRIAGNTAGTNGGGLLNEGSLKLYGGAVDENTARLGGGIFSQSTASLTIRGGRLARNVAVTGGGVAVAGAGLLQGGQITANRAADGADVLVGVDAALSVKGKPQVGGGGQGIWLCADNEDAPTRRASLLMAGPLMAGASLTMELATSTDITATGTPNLYTPKASDALFFADSEGRYSFGVSGGHILPSGPAAAGSIAVYYNTGDLSPQQQVVQLESGESHTIAEYHGSQRPGFSFGGWSDGTRLYIPGSSLKVTANLVLTPMWVSAGYQVVYYWNPTPSDGESYVPMPVGAQQNADDATANPLSYRYGLGGRLAAPLLRPSGSAFDGWILMETPASPTDIVVTDLAQLFDSGDIALAGEGPILLATKWKDGGASLGSPTLENQAPQVVLDIGASYTPVLIGAGSNTPYWFSSNPAVASVDENGRVTALKGGAAQIGVAYLNSENATLFTVYVHSPQPLGFADKLGGATASLAVLQNESVDLAALLRFDGVRVSTATLPDGSPRFTTPSFTSSSSTLPVEQNGSFAPTRTGSTTITVTLQDKAGGSAATYTAKLPVRVLAATAGLSSLTVKPAAKTLLTGQSQKLGYDAKKALLAKVEWRIAPADGDDAAPVVKLNPATGTVTAQNPGVATVECVATDLLGTRRVAACSFTVSRRVQSVAIAAAPSGSQQAAYTLLRNMPGQLQLQLEARVEPFDASNQTMKWTSSNQKIAKVDPATGLVSQGEKNGTATITAAAQDGSGKKHSVKVTVAVPVAQVKLDAKSQDVKLNLGKSHTIKATVAGPADLGAPTVKTLTYTVLEELDEKGDTAAEGSVLTLSSKGVVKAVGPGTATIEVRPLVPLDAFVGQSLTVTVRAPLTTLKLDQKAFAMQQGTSAQLSCTLNGGGAVGAAEADIRWSSSNTGVLAVNARTGKLTAMPVAKNTSATITAQDQGTGKKASVKITVTSGRPVAITGLSTTAKNAPPATLAVGKKWTSKISVLPSNASNKNLIYELAPGDEQYARLDAAAGTLTGLAPGRVRLSVRPADSTGGFTGALSYTITIIRQASSLKMSESKKTLAIGGSCQLGATALPNEAAGVALSWTSSNQKVAKVSTSGFVTAVGGGTATITATAQDGSKKKATAKITVEEISFNSGGGEAAKTLAAGKTLTLKAYFRSTKSKTLSWASSNPAVATASAKGVVTGISGGSAVITATSADGLTARCRLTVSEQKLTRLKIDGGDFTLSAGSSHILLAATATPAYPGLDAAGRDLRWSSNNAAVATVTALPGAANQALLAPVAAGTAKITVQTADGKVGNTITVTVSASAVAATGLAMQKNSTTLAIGKAETLKADILPGGVAVTGLSWQLVESYDAAGNPAEGIATVDAKGKVTAKAPGTAVVQATTRDGGFTARCTVYCVLKN